MIDEKYSDLPFCPICEKHYKYTRKYRHCFLKVEGKDKDIPYLESYYVCENGEIKDNEFVNGALFDANLAERKRAEKLRDLILYSDRLISCPFCDGESEMYICKHTPSGYEYTPRCKDPSCAGRLTKKWLDPDVAVYAWNRRGSSKRQGVQHPCRSCVYFDTCGDNMRTEPCSGRLTERERRRNEKR